ncbi:hypothetical protein HNP46_000538 [Pseudomonas nitritireducens]|uniref:Uncharacterized protein n=1 Tax=Pseudomonas nitroreducens TaxID=46680 RepID=A0A7W7NZZ2_PSENT|nr:hypothetical protein [Pseudomonas nitritireducens]MBB4861727.1 hypothetical protein [Pseudomonas nitritireducens]
MAFPISKIDLEGRGFSRLARFVHKNWPGQEPINLSFAQELLSRSLGYKDFHDLQQHAGRIRYPMGPADASVIAPQAATELKGVAGLDRSSIKSFVESWPVNLLSFHSGFVRSWDIEGYPEPVIEALREAYEYCWQFPAGASARLPNRVSFYNTICLHLGFKAGRSLSDVQTKSILEVLQEYPPEELAWFFDEFQKVNTRLLEVAAEFVKQGHFLPKDAFDHPDLVDGLESLGEFLSGASLATLASQFLEYAIKEKLSQKVFDLYVWGRNDQGFYKKVIIGPKPPKYRFRQVLQVPQGVLTIVVMDSKEESSTVSYCTWTARLLCPKGTCLATAAGGLYEALAERTGPGALQYVAQLQGNHEFALISDYLGRIREPDVPLDETVDALLLESSFITVHRWERSKAAVAGTGLTLLAKALEYISGQITQPLHVLANIRPFQYVDVHSEAIPEAIRVLRAEDESRINAYLDLRLPGLSVVKNGVVKNVTRLSLDPISSLGDTLSAMV